MRLANGILLLVAAVFVACGRAPLSAEGQDSAAIYEVVSEYRAGSMFKLDWNGEGRELVSGQLIEVPVKDARRMTFVSINFMSHAPLPWRSNLDRKLKLGEWSPRDLHTEPIERAKLVRVFHPYDRDLGDFFYRQGVDSKLNSSHYVALCHTPPSWEKKAFHCSTQIEVDSFAVEIRFDKAFLWDFDNLQARVVAAAKDYIARPRTQQIIESNP